MKKFVTIVLLCLFCLLPGPVFAMVKLFLFPRVVHNGKDLLVKDVATVSGDVVLLEKVRNTVIDRSIYSDGFIERKELFRLLKKNTSVSPLIFGSAVRVIPEEAADAEQGAAPSAAAPVFIKKGDTVDVVIRRKHISIEMIGVSMVDAVAGDAVTVELQNRKKVKGILKEGKIVEVVL